MTDGPPWFAERERRRRYNALVLVAKAGRAKPTGKVSQADIDEIILRMRIARTSRHMRAANAVPPCVTSRRALRFDA